MPELVLYQPQLLHPDRRLTTPLEVFRGADFRAALIISGAVASNNLDVLSGGGRIYQVSSPVKVRMLNLEVWNNEAGWLEVEFRDGGSNGGRVLGPYKVDSRSRFSQVGEDLMGRSFTSSIHFQVLSGWTAQPLSNDGVKVAVGWVADPTDFYE